MQTLSESDVLKRKLIEAITELARWKVMWLEAQKRIKELERRLEQERLFDH